MFVDPFAIHQACLQWAHSVLNPHPITVSLHFPSTASQPAFPPAHALPATEPLPGVQQRCSEQPLPAQTPAPDKSRHQPTVCRVVSEVAHLSSSLTHPLVCACHGQEVQQPSADAMQQSQTICPVSGHMLTPAQLKRNDSMVQVCIVQLTALLPIAAAHLRQKLALSCQIC